MLLVYYLLWFQYGAPHIDTSVIIVYYFYYFLSPLNSFLFVITQIAITNGEPLFAMEQNDLCWIVEL